MTKHYPQHQSIASPMPSREKGDWGFKRPLPLRTTLATSTPLVRIKQFDSVESVTDFASAADHSLSLEKFQELRVAVSVPQQSQTNEGVANVPWIKSVFEETMDAIDVQDDRGDELRWKFQGPWLARMPEGDFVRYLEKKVRPKRAEFRAMLREMLAEDMTNRQNQMAKERGTPAPPRTNAEDITEEQFTSYLRLLRNDRVILYALVSRLLDLAPPGRPVGFIQSMWPSSYPTPLNSPYGKSGPPPSHPSAGISYLRTSSFMENHAVYGPQSKRAPTVARVVYPRFGLVPARLGVGGFVASTPAGDNEFNMKHGRGRTSGNKSMLGGIMHLDTTTFGGAKAYVEPLTARVDPSGKVVLLLQETTSEAQVIAKESKGLSDVYDDGPGARVEQQLGARPGAPETRWYLNDPKEVVEWTSDPPENVDDGTDRGQRQEEEVDSGETSRPEPPPEGTAPKE